MAGGMGLSPHGGQISLPDTGGGGMSGAHTPLALDGPGKLRANENSWETLLSQMDTTDCT